MHALIVWGKFVLILLLIYVFGTRATRSADIIAEKKGLAKAFMGLVFISMVTSFPELFAGISAVALVDSPDVAMGQVLGSCVFNLLIIAMVDIGWRKSNVFLLEGKLNFLPLAFSFILLNLLTLTIAAGIELPVFHLGAMSIVILVLYLSFMRILYRERKADSIRQDYTGRSLAREVFMFILSSLIIIGVGIYLPYVAEEIGTLMNWNDSFVGTVFVAFVTSFPELVVSLSTARMGAFDMLLGNIAGSNMFNIAIVIFFDLFYFKGVIFGAVSPANVLVGLIALMMTFIVFFAVMRKSRARYLNLISVNGMVLIALYILNLVLTFGHRHTP